MDKVVTEARVYDGIGRRGLKRAMTDLKQLVEDTYAEGFRSIYGKFWLRFMKWLQHCVNAATGHASSTIVRL